MEKIKSRIIKFLGIEHLGDNPNSDRYTYINDDDTVKRQHLEEYKVWYIGDSDELLNFYTGRGISGNAKEPLYNRNKPQYFWGISPQESNIKRVHSGIPNAIVTTLVNAIGVPEITEPTKDIEIKKILDKNNFNVLLNQQARPLTLVEGWGAYKIVYDKELSDVPIFQYYEASNVDFVVKHGITIGIVFKDYYKHNGKDYMLLETRRIANGNSLIEYELFRLEKSNAITPVDLYEIEELQTLPKEGYVIEGFKKVMAVPTKYFYDTLNKDYGKSIFSGKIDLFDDLDQSLSQRSQTSRVSTPVEYYPTDLLERDKHGQALMPSVYNRQYVQTLAHTDGDGNTVGAQIFTTQPQLNFEQYSGEQKAILDMLLTGILSPSTMGIDLAKKDNADAQREKEKITIMTRNNVIDMETKIIKDLVSLALFMKEYMDTGSISIKEYDISVKYSEFANPSFESLSSILSPMFTGGSISTEMYVNKLYGDSLSEEEKLKEIAWLDSKQQEDNLEMGDFDLNGTNEDFANENLQQQETNEEPINPITE